MSDLRPEMPDLRPETPDMRPDRPDGGDERIDELRRRRQEGDSAWTRRSFGETIRSFG